MPTPPVLTWEMLAERAMNKADTVFTASADIITNAINTYGPQAVDMMLTVIRLDNLQKLIYGGLLLIICVLIGIIGFFKINKHAKEDLDGRWSLLHGGVLSFILIYAVFTIFLVLPFSVNTVLDVWTWVGVVEPKVWVAKQVVNKITNTLQK